MLICYPQYLRPRFSLHRTENDNITLRPLKCRDMEFSVYNAFPHLSAFFIIKSILLVYTIKYRNAFTTELCTLHTIHLHILSNNSRRARSNDQYNLSTYDYGTCPKIFASTPYREFVASCPVVQKEKAKQSRRQLSRGFCAQNIGWGSMHGLAGLASLAIPRFVLVVDRLDWRK